MQTILSRLTLGLVFVWIANVQTFAVFLARHVPEAFARSAYDAGGFVLAALLILPVVLLWGLTRGAGGWRGADGLWNSTIGRRVRGLVVRGVLFVALFALVDRLAVMVMGGYFMVHPLALVGAWRARRQAKTVLGRATRPLRWLIAGRHKGIGGTARWSGLLDEWANPWEPGKVLLGRSKYDPNWIVGMDDDRHICTIATSRAGKGRSVIIPNLLTWPGSALVIDPKGQNARITALARGKGGEELSRALGQTVRIVDPLGEITEPALRPLVARFNPMAELDPEAGDYAERIAAITDALVVPGNSNQDSFWDNASRGLIAGLVDYAMRSPKVPPQERNLVTVRGLLVHPDGPPVEEMAEMGGLAQAAAAGLAVGRQNATADVKYTAMTHTQWLDSAGMQRTLEASDFSLGDLNDGNTTVYLVLPPEYIDIRGGEGPQEPSRDALPAR